MSDWSIHSLSEFIEVKHGFAFKGEFFKDEETEDYLLTPGNFAIGGGFKADKFKYYDGPVPEDYVLDEDDLVVTMTDLSKQADTLGYSALVPTIKGKRLLHNQRVGLVQFKNNGIDKTFLYFLLRSKEYRHHVVSTATGSTVKHTSPTKITSFKFQLPPYDMQVTIGQHLMKLESKIELNHQINQTLEQIAQAIFKSWFVDFEPVKAKIEAKQNGQDPERAAMRAISGKTDEELDQLSPDQRQQLTTTAKHFPDELVDSVLGEVPKECEVKKLKEICRVLNGRAYKNSEFKEEGTPIVRIQNLSGAGKTVYSDLDLPEDKLIDKEDFIYAWSATFGPYMWRGPKSIYHYHIWKMDVDEKVISRYFLYLSMFRKTEQMKSAGTGSIFTHLTKTMMEGQDILVATPKLNKYFKILLESYFKKITILEEENDTLMNIRDSLLPKLLSGEISIGGTQSITEAVA